MRAMISCVAIIITVSTPWRVCNAESSRSGRWEVAFSSMFLGGESASVGSVTAEEDDWTLYGVNVGTNINEHLNLNTEIVFGSVDLDVSGLPVGTSVSGDQDTLVWLVLQRYKSSSKTMQPVDDTPVKDYFLGGYRHGHENDYENQTRIDAIPAPV